MPSLGKRCHELRIVDRDNTWRIMYHLDADAVVILDVFAKKTGTTPKSVIDKCKRRLREYLQLRYEGVDNMDKKKAQRLKAAGWAVGDAGDFLELTDEERAFIETKLALAAAVRERRKRRKLSQTQLAQRLGSSQSRVAKMEAADPTVSLDLLVRSLLSLGATQADIAKAIRKGVSRSAA